MDSSLDDVVDQPLGEVAGSSIAEEASISRGYAWLAGAIGAAIALSVGEVFDRLSDSLISLVVGVADFLVDITPGDVVAQSINTLGSNQKPLLIFGIILGSIAVGGLLGMAARKSAAIIPAGFFAFGVFGGFVTARSDLSGAAGSWLAALVAAGIGSSVALVLLTVARRSNTSQSTAAVASSGGFDRRAVLYGSAAAGAVALTAAARVGRTSAAEVARDELLADTATTVGATGGEQMAFSTGAFDDIPGITQFITPISPEDEFYLIDTAIRKPEVDPSTWELSITGPYVDNPITYTYQDLLDRELVTTEVTLSCVSNPVGGDLVGNAVWTGVPLIELLEEAGVQDPTNPDHQIFSRSVDGFTCGFPLPLAYDGRTTMVALMMNGEPLPLIHGFPARLVVAGLYGYVSATKWVEEIQVTDWIGVDGFWQPRGWSKEGPIKTQSRIDTPVQGGSLRSGTTTIAGIAWNPTIGIDRVEVGFTSNEDQATTEWVAAELADVESNETWVQWRYEWDAPPGDWFLQVRATDSTGFTQSPTIVQPAPNGAEGYHTIIVRAT